MKKKGYLFWDSETADSQQRICQAAYILTDFEGSRIGEPVCQVINPESEIGWWSKKNLDIDWGMLSVMPTFDRFCEQVDLLNLLRDYIFVAHNANGADIHHIKKTLVAYGIEMPKIEAVDTMLVAQQNGLPRSLKGLCRHYGIDLNAHHNALGDAEACLLAFKGLVEDFGAPEPAEWSRSLSSSRGSRQTFGGLGLVHRSEETVEEVLERAELTGCRGDVNEIDDPVGLKVKVSGFTPGYTRVGILDALKACGMDAGEGNPGRKTQYLAIGDNVGEKKLNSVFDGSSSAKIVTTGEMLEILNRFGEVN